MTVLALARLMAAVVIAVGPCDNPQLSEWK
jgi:hypothetical protein